MSEWVSGYALPMIKSERVDLSKKMIFWKDDNIPFYGHEWLFILTHV